MSGPVDDDRTVRIVDGDDHSRLLAQLHDAGRLPRDKRPKFWLEVANPALNGRAASGHLLGLQVLITLLGEVDDERTAGESWRFEAVIDGYDGVPAWVPFKPGEVVSGTYNTTSRGGIMRAGGIG